jgi:hypothetical protein
MITRRLASSLLTAGLLASLGLASAAPADATVRARSYANCKALNKVYPHGVGLRGARDHVRGRTRPVTNFARDAAAYHLNDGTLDNKRSRGERNLDADRDGIACEKR